MPTIWGSMATAYDYITVRNPRNRSARKRTRQRTTAPLPPPSPAQRTLRRWGSIIIMLCAAGVVVAYISNVIAVNRLMTEITQAERRCDSVRTVNERLRADLLRLMAPERISSIASSELGMVQQSVPPKELSYNGVR